MNPYLAEYYRRLRLALLCVFPLVLFLGLGEVLLILGGMRPPVENRPPALIAAAVFGSVGLAVVGIFYYFVGEE